MYFEVLGPLVVRTDAGEPVVVPDTKVRTLLLDLLVHRGRPVPADRLIDDLWGAKPPRNAIGTLQARVSQLRTAFERAEPGARSLVRHGAGGYTLDVPEDVVDSNEFERLRGNGELAAALGLWRGPAYADVVDAEFARTARDRLEELRLTTLEDHLELRQTQGDEVLGEVVALVSDHPLRERLRGIQLRALYRAGRQDEALRAFAELRELLADELGADPGPELAAIHEAILRHDPGLSAQPRSTVPMPLDHLIGRDQAMKDAAQFLKTNRLVTLIGPGGVGKTRLAVELATKATAYWVELAGVGAADVVGAVAAVVGVRDDSSDLPARVGQALRSRPGLVVLDNCEHLLDAAADTVRQLLAEVPEMRVLATSREALGLVGERLFEVVPLDDDSAAELFTARAIAAAGVVDDAEAVTAICRQLDGIPLALELAATRVRGLGLANLAAGLDDRFRLLAGGRGVPERQRTLRATLDWSWELLGADERTMLRRLAVHADGFTLEAAAEVGDQPAELVGRLVDRSLVVPTGDRYRLLESVVAYGQERLAEAGETARTRTRHAAYYAALAERAEPQLRGDNQCTWLERLDQESANLRLALQYASPQQALRLVNAAAWYWYLRGRLGEGRRALATALERNPDPSPARAAAMVWQVGFTATAADGSNLTEASESALSSYDEFDEPIGQARALWFLTATQWAYGDPELLMRRIDQAIATFTRAGDKWGLAATLSTRAQLAITHADLPAMRRDGEESLRLFGEIGDGWGRLQAGYALIVAAEITGDYPKATGYLQESLRLAESLGLWTEVSFRTSGLGRIALLTGDYARADELHEAARRIAIEHSNKSAEEYAEVGLGLAARRQGRLDEAEERLGKWLTWLTQVGGIAGVAFVTAQLGFIAEQRGDHERAAELHERGHQAARELGDERAIALALEGLAGAKAAAALSRPDDASAAVFTEAETLLAEAEALLAEAEALRRAVGLPLPPAERFDVDRIAGVISRARRRPSPGCR
ncbi:putative ATPase [Kribbella amoyensis]|uniref:Putative ATPase n=1 Tax=Kribbella amoyensis TaxID=996641 RepID=A0A561BP92_9ACTN|nr:BTAD domain-containing putative transcriptional regulator [Kribbella amoyensis]TWD80684.1 putative ATPase [Kribbella amoyensis]